MECVHDYCHELDIDGNGTSVLSIEQPAFRQLTALADLAEPHPATPGPPTRLARSPAHTSALGAATNVLGSDVEHTILMGVPTSVEIAQPPEIDAESSAPRDQPSERLGDNAQYVAQDDAAAVESTTLSAPDDDELQPPQQRCRRMCWPDR